MQKTKPNLLSFFHSSRAQGATEYLVILGAVLLVSLVAVSAVGQSASSGSTIKEEQSSAYWSSTTPIAFSSFKLNSNALSLKLTNRESQKIRITSIKADNGAGIFSTLYSGSIILNSGEEYSLTANTYLNGGNPCSSSLAGKGFEITQLAFTYDVSSSMTGLTQTGNKPIVGKCAQPDAFCAVSSDYNTSRDFGSDRIYCDNFGGLWTYRFPSTTTWAAYDAKCAESIAGWPAGSWEIPTFTRLRQEFAYSACPGWPVSGSAPTICNYATGEDSIRYENYWTATRGQPISYGVCFGAACAVGAGNANGWNGESGYGGRCVLKR